MIVVWRITQRCNLTCPFCEWDRSLPGERSEAALSEALRFAQVLAGHQRRSGDPVLLSWLGGEPTLWQPLHVLAPRVKDLGIAQSMTTNGSTLASPKVQALVLRDFCEVTVSVDGFAGFHDRLRGWPGGFDRLRDGVTTLAAKRADRRALKLRVNVVLMRQNLAAFADLCVALAGWGVDEITFNALGGRDRPEFFPGHGLRPQDVEALATLAPPLRDRLAALGVRLCGGDAYVARIAASAVQQRVPGTACAPGQSFLFIDERGRVAPCDFTVGDYGVPMAQLQTADDLAALPERFASQRHAARAGACDDCRSTQVFSKFSA